MNVLIGRNRNKNKNPTQLLWLCSLLSFSSVNKVNSYGLSTNNNYFTVIRTSLDKANIISLQPQGWLNKATRNSYGYRNSNNKNSDDKNVNEITKSSNRIREVLYVPSIFNMKLTNEIDHVLDDEHVCSLLCDRGFTVHCVNPKNNIDYKNAIADTMKWRMTKNVLPRNIAILANELAVPQVMSYLAEVNFICIVI